MSTRSTLVQHIIQRAIPVFGVSLALVSPGNAWAGDRVTSPQPGATSNEIVSPLPIDALDGSAARRTIKLGVTVGECTKRVELARLVQRPTSVQIQMTSTDPAYPKTSPPTVCPDSAKFRCVSVVLSKPLGKRPVVDLTTSTHLKPGYASGWGGAVFPHTKQTCRPPGRVA